MLNCKMVAPDILEVTEIAHSFVDTKKSYWYFNIKDWTQTSTGNKNSYLTERMVDMTNRAILWTKNWYLPRLRGDFNEGYESI